MRGAPVGRAPRLAADLTTTPRNGVMVQKEGCFNISNVDPDIKKVEEIEAKDPSLVGK